MQQKDQDHNHVILIKLLIQQLIIELMNLFRKFNNCVSQIYTAIFVSNVLVTTYSTPYGLLNTYTYTWLSCKFNNHLDSSTEIIS